MCEEEKPLIEMGKNYRTSDGRRARVICIDRMGDFPVVALIEPRPDHYREELHCFTKHGEGYGTPQWLFEYDPLVDLPIDSKIWVRTISSEDWLPRRFAGVDENGSVLTYPEGKDRWAYEMSGFGSLLTDYTTKTGKYRDWLAKWSQYKLAKEGETCVPSK